MSTHASPAQRYAESRRRRAQDGPALAKFQALYDFTFDDYQRRACQALNEGHGVLVAAPTGSGKTVIGEFAVHLALAAGRKCFYTTPIKALSNQKFGDLVRRYGPDRVGLLTGDNSINGEAPVVVMTTEVLRNMLYGGSATLDGLGYVVLDEVHYLADRFRGAVWEEVIIHLPESVRVVALSATVSNAEEFGEWLTQVRGGTTVIVDEHRPVPLWQHVLADGHLYDLFVSPNGRARAADSPQVNPELLRLSRREEGQARRRAPGRPVRGGRRPPRPQAAEPAADDRAAGRGRAVAGHHVHLLRAACDAAVRQCLDAGLRLTTPEEAEIITEVAQRRTVDLPEADLAVLGYGEWLTGLQRGIAAHHAGMLPTFKEVVEELFEAGLVRVVFATETLALGINMPAQDRGHRAAGQVERRDTRGADTGGVHPAHRPGRAARHRRGGARRGAVAAGPGPGRRGWPGRHPDLPAQLQLPALLQHGREPGRPGRAGAGGGDPRVVVRAVPGRPGGGGRRPVGAARPEQLEELAVTCDRGDFAEYFAAAPGRCPSWRGSGQAAGRGPARRGGRARSASCAVATSSGCPAAAARAWRWCSTRGCRSRAAAADNLPLPLVLTAGRQVRRLSAADFPVPVQPIDRVRIPNWFSARSPKHRRDLAASVRDQAGRRGTRRSSRAAAGAPAGGAGGDRRAAPPAARPPLSRLPRPGGARPAGRAPCPAGARGRSGWRPRWRAGRTSSPGPSSGSAPCSARLGYIDGDQVTEAGRRLACLYTELDLLAAECLRRGLWDGLSPAELAACVSVLTFESRTAEAAAPVRLPGGPVREVLGPDGGGVAANSTRSRARTGCRSCASRTSGSPGRRTPGPAASRWRPCSGRT